MTERPYKNVLLADRVYERLEDDIIFGRYAPGQVLTELGLAEELGVSRTPVREAMRRLTQERLIADGDSGKGRSHAGPRSGLGNAGGRRR